MKWFRRDKEAASLLAILEERELAVRIMQARINFLESELGKADKHIVRLERGHRALEAELGQQRMQDVMLRAAIGAAGYPLGRSDA